MTMRRIILAIVLVITAWTIIQAVPAKSVPFTYQQSDGTTVTLVMQGGEFNHSLMTLDGLTVARAMNGDYYYTVRGSMSDVRAHDKGHRSIEEQAFVVAYRNQMTLTGMHRMPRRADENTSPQVPTMGSPRIPIILVNYSDVQFIDEDPVATFENQFNEMDYSCLHYFESQSRGKFSPRFEILGPVQLPQTREFYGANIWNYGMELDQQLGTMIYDACTGIGDDVDFSDYDNDGDGFVDVVVVLYAGVGEAQAWSTVPESVWPCQWDMQESYDWGCSTIGPFQLDGVTIDRYAVFNELEGSSNASTFIDGVGTFCHEFGHCLGLPDFYPTNGAYYYGMNSWDIMDHGCYLNNGYRPAGYTSYERHFMGWMDLIDPEENTRYVMSPLNTDDGTAVKVTNDANPDEYYLLEYRVKTGWDEYLPAEGIMIIHVDYDKTAWDENTPNNIASHPRMTIIPADNVLSGSTNRYDLWPQGALDSLTNNSTPAARVYAGEYMNKPLTGMTVDTQSHTAAFWYMKAKYLRGDVNRDGEVNITDINALIDIILGGNSYYDGDVNRDGEVNIADVNAVIDLILS